MEDLLVEMKMDVARLPNELSKIPSVSKQLKMDELSTLTKMAQRGEVVPASVITQAPVNKSVISSGNAVATTEKNKTLPSSVTQQSHLKSSSKKETVVVQDSKSSKNVIESTGGKSTASSNPSTTQYTPYTPTSGSALVPLTGSTGLRLQTPEGLIVAASSMPYTALKTSKQSSTSNDHGATSYAAVNVPAYVDSNQVYQAAAVQLVPVSAGQQIMVWPSSAVVQQGKAPAQLTVVQGSQLLSMVDASSGSSTQAQKTSSSNISVSSANIITID